MIIQKKNDNNNKLDKQNQMMNQVKNQYNKPIRIKNKKK